MRSTEIIFMGSKPIGYNCLNFLISQKEPLGIKIAGILTNNRKEFGDGHNLNALARDHQIPLLNTLDELPECDIIYSVQYHQILKQRHINKARRIAINLHMAPLPEYRGSNQFSFAIIEGKKEFGATIHQLDSRIDHGDILFQKRFPIPHNCWVDELYELTYNAALNLFKQTLSHIVHNNYQKVPQQLLTPKYGSSLHYRNEMDPIKTIDLSWEQEKMERHIRATSMPGFEPPYCIIDGQKVFFTKKAR
jgi:methionyl-tRNA formyltransferase